MRCIFLSTLFLFLMVVSCKKEEEKPRLKNNEINNLIHDNTDRTFLLHVPSTYHKEAPMPLLVVLHGYSGEARVMEASTGLSAFADQKGFIVVYPEGRQYPWTEDYPRAWNVGGPWESWTQHCDDVGFISALIDLVSENYAIDPSRIYVTGYSNGGRMTFRVGAELGCKIAAIAPLAGQMVFSGAWPADCSVPVIYFHAVNDEVVPIQAHTIDGFLIQSDDSVLSSWALHYGCTASCDTLYQIPDLLVKQWPCSGSGMKIVSYVAQRGGHHWLVPENSGISMNDTLWAFFNTLPR